MSSPRPASKGTVVVLEKFDLRNSNSEPIQLQNSLSNSQLLNDQSTSSITMNNTSSLSNSTSPVTISTQQQPSIKDSSDNVQYSYSNYNIPKSALLRNDSDTSLSLNTNSSPVLSRESSGTKKIVMRQSRAASTFDQRKRALLTVESREQTYSSVVLGIIYIFAMLLY
jgi:hypothetical protein